MEINRREFHSAGAVVVEKNDMLSRLQIFAGAKRSAKRRLAAPLNNRARHALSDIIVWLLCDKGRSLIFRYEFGQIIALPLRLKFLRGRIETRQVVVSAYIRFPACIIRPSSKFNLLENAGRGIKPEDSIITIARWAEKLISLMGNSKDRRPSGGSTEISISYGVSSRAASQATNGRANHPPPPSDQIFADRARAVETAKEWLSGDYVIFDTETTGLGDNDQIIDLAVIDTDGNVLADSLVKPYRKRSLSAATTAYNNITWEMIKGAPSWPEVFGPALDAVGHRQAISYNADFDFRLLRQTNSKHAYPRTFRGKENCLMLLYAQYKGEWNHYYGNYKWHKLPGTKHRALADCYAALEILNVIAENKDCLPLTTDAGSKQVVGEAEARDPKSCPLKLPSTLAESFLFPINSIHAAANKDSRALLISLGFWILVIVASWSVTSWLLSTLGYIR